MVSKTTYRHVVLILGAVLLVSLVLNIYTGIFNQPPPTEFDPKFGYSEMIILASAFIGIGGSYMIYFTRKYFQRNHLRYALFHEIKSMWNDINDTAAIAVDKIDESEIKSP